MLLSGLMLIFVPSAVAQSNNCLTCHTDWEEGELAPSHLIEKDIHFKAGLGCADCHGGDPALDDMDDVRNSRGYQGIPGAAEIPNFCGRCHSDPTYMIKHNPSLPTDQLDKYKTSVHGQRLLKRGDTKVANCVSCHSVHDIEAPQIPTSTVYAINLPHTCAKCHSDSNYMASYPIPTDQFDKYARSVHGIALLENKDIGAPACNDCHGNHGAIPPGISSISAVCGMCHSLIADQFAGSPHKKAFDENDIPECEICHSNHLVEKPQLYWVGTSDSALCVDCHDAEDGTIGLVTADSINSTITHLYGAYREALSATDAADEKGMMVTDLRFGLKEIKQSIIKSQTAVHSFSAAEVSKSALPGIESAKKIQKASLGKIDDYYFRRKGLGIATLIISILALALYLKIRSIEK